MKTLNAKNQKTLEALQQKANGKGRMPSVKRIAALLEELGIWFEAGETSTTKERGSSQNTFVTSRGKAVEGKKIKVVNIRGGFLVMDTTCSFFSRNTESFAWEFMKIIERA